MFTGIVTDVGEITAVTPGGQAGDRRFVVRTKHDMAPIPIGASIACSGCCLTVVEKGAGLVRRRGLGRDARQDPSRRLASRASGSTSNGRSSSATSWAAISSTAMSTASGEIVSMTPEGGSVRFVFEAPADLAPLHRRQGLDRGRRHLADGQRGRRTIASASTSFRTPQAVTTLGQPSPGQRVNLEIDMLARYVARLLEHGRT